MVELFWFLWWTALICGLLALGGLVVHVWIWWAEEMDDRRIEQARRRDWK